MKLFDSRTPLLAALLALSIPAPQALAAAPEPEEITNAMLAERLEASHAVLAERIESARKEAQAQNALLAERVEAGFREARRERETIRREAQIERDGMRQEGEARIKGVEGKLEVLLVMFGVLAGALVAFVVLGITQLFWFQRNMVDKEDFAALREKFSDLMFHLASDGARSPGARPQEVRSQGARSEGARSREAHPEAPLGYQPQPERHEAGAYGAVGEPEGPPKPRSGG